ncbi:hypothetical protein SAMN02910358_00570 [Lachnospiraceae bacterium XBB1006]|nr:hypothetical protein SAMN02910358_00570 [Lachnospiraceae bacterium XBB1006]
MKPEELKSRLSNVHRLVVQYCWGQISQEDLIALKELDDWIGYGFEIETQLSTAITKMEEMAKKHEDIATNLKDMQQKQIHLSAADSARFCIKMLKDELKQTKKLWQDKK